MADRRIVQAASSFNVNNAVGVPWQVRRGDLYWSDDPIVATNASLFGEPDVLDSTAGIRRTVPTFAAVEMAVAPPGGATRAPVTKVGKVAAGRPVAAGVGRPSVRPPGEV